MKKGYTIKKDNAGVYRWRLKDELGRLLAYSSEGYGDLADCKSAVKLLQNGRYRLKKRAGMNGHYHIVQALNNEVLARIGRSCPSLDHFEKYAATDALEVIY